MTVILTIGGLSKTTGVHIETIRYYEKSGVLPKPSRTAGGHRTYTHEDTKRLSFISCARGLGFSLTDIRGLLDLVSGESLTCGEVHELTLRHIEKVRDRIQALKLMETTLSDMAAVCIGGDIPDCPIIDAMYDNKALPVEADPDA